MENVHTGKWYGFTGLEPMCDFLCRETGIVPDVDLVNEGDAPDLGFAWKGAAGMADVDG